MVDHCEPVISLSSVQSDRLSANVSCRHRNTIITRPPTHGRVSSGEAGNNATIASIGIVSVASASATHQ